MTDAFTITQPDDPAHAVPMVVHIPHAGTRVPDDVRARMHLPDDALADEIRAMTDWHTDALFGPAGQEAGATVMVNHISRLVADPERLPNHAEPMAAVGMGAVYTHTRHGVPLRSKVETPALLDRFFQPWADHVEAAVAAQVDAFGRCLVLDAHSFPSTAFPFEDPGAVRPDIDLGWSEPHRPDGLVESVSEVVEAHGWSVAENSPFAGAYVPLLRFGSDERVRSLMVEVNRGTHLDEATGAPGAGWDVAARVIGEVVHHAAAWAAALEDTPTTPDRPEL